MKKAMTALLVLVTLAATAQTETARDEQNMMGTWRNKSGAGLDIVDSGTVYVVRSGGEREKVPALWTTGTKPQLTLVLTKKDSASTTTVKTTLRLVNEDTMQWKVLESETKPVSFRYREGEMIFLKRISRLLN